MIAESDLWKQGRGLAGVHYKSLLKPNRSHYEGESLVLCPIVSDLGLFVYGIFLIHNWYVCGPFTAQLNRKAYLCFSFICFTTSAKSWRWNSSESRNFKNSSPPCPVMYKRIWLPSKTSLFFFKIYTEIFHNGSKRSVTILR
jgi:hypothetical protein